MKRYSRIYPLNVARISTNRTLWLTIAHDPGSQRLRHDIAWERHPGGDNTPYTLYINIGGLTKNGFSRLSETGRSQPRVNAELAIVPIRAPTD